MLYDDMGTYIGRNLPRHCADLRVFHDRRVAEREAQMFKIIGFLALAIAIIYAYALLGFIILKTMGV